MSSVSQVPLVTIFTWNVYAYHMVIINETSNASFDACLLSLNNTETKTFPRHVNPFSFIRSRNRKIIKTCHDFKAPIVKCWWWIMKIYGSSTFLMALLCISRDMCNEASAWLSIKVIMYLCCLSVCLFAMSACLFARLSVCVCLSACVCTSVCLPVCLSVCLSVYLSVCLSGK